MNIVEDDFVVLESETPKPSQRGFLLLVATLLATLILSSLCIVTLFVTEAAGDTSLSQAQSTLLPPNTPTAGASIISPSSSSSTVSQPIVSSSPLSVTVESAKGAIRIIEYTGAHRIIEYGGLGSQSSPDLAATRQSPHRIIRYDIPSLGEDSGTTNEEAE